MSSIGRVVRLLAVAAAACAAFVVPSGAAGAHSDAGTMGIELTQGSTPASVNVRILLEYANDRDTAPGATVVASATGPEGVTVGPTPLADRGAGSYEGVLTMPSDGDWTVTVTATGPAASASAGITLVSASGTVAPAPTTTTPADIAISADRAARDDTSSSDDGPGVLLLAAIAVAVVAVAGAAVALVRRRR